MNDVPLLVNNTPSHDIVIRDRPKGKIDLPMGNINLKVHAEIVAQRDESSKSLDYSPLLAADTPSLSYDNICFYGITPIKFGVDRQYVNTPLTRQYADSLLKVFTEITLRSVDEALIGNSSVQMYAPIISRNPAIPSTEELIASLQPAINSLRHVKIDMLPDAIRRAEMSFDNSTTCKWVALFRVDSDDPLMPGYFDWIAQKIVPKLEVEGRQGALVGSRVAPRIGYGPEVDSCYSFFNKYPDGKHWSGVSFGQTRVLRRDVFLALGKPFRYPMHHVALSTLRRDIFKLLWKNEQVPELLNVTNVAIMANISLLEKENDAYFTDLTGIPMFETTQEGFGPAGLYLQSPVSGHYRGHDDGLSLREYRTCTSCTRENWSMHIRKATYLNSIAGIDFDYVFDSLHSIFG